LRQILGFSLKISRGLGAGGGELSRANLLTWPARVKSDVGKKYAYLMPGSKGIGLFQVAIWVWSGGGKQIKGEVSE